MKGDVVVVPFPFSDLTCAKRRPALVLANLEGDDLILCQITSRKVTDRYAISIVDRDFEGCGLKSGETIIRPNCALTADRRIVLYKIGRLRPGKKKGAIKKVVRIFSRMGSQNQVNIDLSKSLG